MRHGITTHRSCHVIGNLRKEQAARRCNTLNSKELGHLIESFAPLSLQEDWDNSGYNVDLHNSHIRNVMLCLDVTDSLIREAREHACDVIIAHHPILFREVRRIDSQTHVGSLIVALAEANISVYCAHTTMDSSSAGINRYVASLLKLDHVEALEPLHTSPMYKLAVTVPPEHADAVLNALFAAGAGSLGAYKDCSFSMSGTGTFRPLSGSHPSVGSLNELSCVEEVLLQVLVPEALRSAAIESVQRTHPYEVPAIDLYPLSADPCPDSGMGAVGDLAVPVSLNEFARSVKKLLDCPCVEYAGDPDLRISRVALCTGAGASLMRSARAAGADVLVTGEAKHSSFVEHEIPLIVAGHYDTEKWFVDAMRCALQSAGLELEYNVGICVPRGMQRPYIVI